MRRKAGAAREPGAEWSRCGSVGQVSKRMGWSSLKLEYRDVPEPLENCKIRVFTAQRSLGRINALHYVTHKIKDSWRKKQVTSVLFLDIKGAFPNAVNEKLIANMIRRKVPTKIV